MKNIKWLKSVISVAVVVAIAVILYMVAKNLLGGRGVSASKEDILMVFNSISSYLIIIGVAIIALIASYIISAVIRISKEKKLLLRCESAIATLIVIVVCINLICVGPMSALLNVSAGAKGEMSEKTKSQSEEAVLHIAKEGIVLLKNKDNVLPLSSEVTKLNVFGWSSTNPIYGGTGSGAFGNSENQVTLIQGLEMSGYEMNQDLIKFYTRYLDVRPDIGMYIQDWTVPEPTIKEYDRKKLFEKAQEFSDTALVVISRSGGEGADLPMSITDEDTVANAATTGYGVRYTSNVDDVDPSKHYLELTNRETAMIERVNESFNNVIVVINAANTMELGWINEYEHINGVIWCAGASKTGFQALGEIINGTVNPSGKTVDTYLYDLFDSPAANNIGDFEYDNVSELVNTKSSDNYKATFVNYVEGIYVGYKFYETASSEGSIDYDNVVQFPFGYGLSYSSFEQKITDFSQKENTVTLKVKVTNTGSMAGKDVVEVYYNPPYTNGGIEKATANLIEFAKTSLLEPGKSETVEISFELEDMASYDYLNNGCYVLEAGDYEISIRTDSHHIVDTRAVTVADDVIYNDANDGKRTSDTKTAVNRFEFAAGDVTYLSRANGFANYKEATASPTSYSMSDKVKDEFIANAVYNPADYVDSNDVMPATDANNGLTLEHMAGVNYDDAEWEQLLDQLTVSDMENLISVGGYMTSEIKSIGFSATIETDGPSGLHSNFTELAGTNFPASVMLASTWNKELAEKKGELIGRQGQELGISGWYGPAMNIHRTGFSGRNFEYYSEDGILSGLNGTAEVKGARKYNMQTYVKHFALNDQETNRLNMLCTWSNEQAIREIYLKPFEMAFKDGGSKSVMSSYNYIGNIWAGACSALLKDVLKDEWGVNGTVVSDWFGGYGYMNADLSIRNGGDRMLTTTDTAKLQDTKSATAVIAMRNASHNILYSLANSNVIEGSNRSMALWKQVLIGADILIGLLVILAEAAFVIKLKKIKKKEDEI